MPCFAKTGRIASKCAASDAYFDALPPLRKAPFSRSNTGFFSSTCAAANAETRVLAVSAFAMLCSSHEASEGCARVRRGLSQRILTHALSLSTTREVCNRILESHPGVALFNAACRFLHPPQGLTPTAFVTAATASPKPPKNGEQSTQTGSPFSIW